MSSKALEQQNPAGGPGFAGIGNEKTGKFSLSVSRDSVNDLGQLLIAALKYAAWGWKVFPCSVDKKPLVKDWPNVATTDPEQVRAWWAKWPGASIGCPTGPGLGAWVLDVDLPDGPATLAVIESKHGKLPATVGQKTGGRGRQLFFKFPEGREVRNTAGERGKLGPGLDVRGAGGYVILPPSKHPSGGSYSWLAAEKSTLAVAPEWLLDLVAPLPKPEALRPPTAFPAKSADTSPYGRRAMEEEAAKVADTSQGGRNHALNDAAFALGQLAAGGEVDRAEAEVSLLDAAIRAGLSEGEARKTISSGLQAGEKEPRTAPEKTLSISQVEASLDDWEPASGKPWPILEKLALPGLAGDFVSLATSNSEADPAAVLITLLVRFGCEVAGPEPTMRPHIFIGDTRHEPRLFAVVAGKSSKARKGTSAAPVNRLFKLDNSLNSLNSLPMAATSPGPLSSGEGIVWNVRDEIQTWEINKTTKIGEWVVKDPGISDKRLSIIDEELAAALRCIKREGNTLSTTLRGLWDSGSVQPLTKTSPTKTSQAHVCILTHITLEELARVLDEVELFNGFANRFLWVLAERKRLVPRPRPLPVKELARLQKGLIERLDLAQCAGLIEMSSRAYDLWDSEYSALTAERGGLFGAVVGRAEAQVQRLSLVYALLDGKAEIDCPHLEAALAFWRYCEASAAYIFEARQADPLREKILAALRQACKAMTATELHKALSNHATSEQVKSALSALVSSGLVTHEKEQTKGKPKNLFNLCEKSELSELTSAQTPSEKVNSLNSHNSQASSENEAPLHPWDGPDEVEI